MRATLAPGNPEAAARHLLASALFRPGQTISAYIAVGDEFDPAPLLAELTDLGATLCLPVVVGRQRPLLFRGWAPGDALVDVAYGLREPSPAAPLLEPDLLIVPLLAFDRRGHRLGYGGGYYDRTLSALRRVKPVLAVGWAHAGQEMPGLPAGADDERLDWVATEDELIRCR